MTQALTTQPQAKPEFPAQLDAFAPQIAQALPSHISLDKFKRVILTVVNQKPELLACDRRSLFNSAAACAADGLLPDGREAALVKFRTKKGDQWVDAVQYMPMVRGIVKLARQSGDISQISANIVYENEAKDRERFDYVLGDDERFIHRPMLTGDRGEPVLVYATVTFKDGSVQREFLTMGDIAKIRNVSRAKDSGPWKDWPEEMMKKSAIRRLSKYLALSPDVQRTIQRDDEMTEFQVQRQAALRLAATQLAPADEPEAAPHDPQTGEVIEAAPADPFDWAKYVELTAADIATAQTIEALNEDWAAIKERMDERSAPQDARDTLTRAYLERAKALKGGRK